MTGPAPTPPQRRPEPAPRPEPPARSAPSTARGARPAVRLSPPAGVAPAGLPEPVREVVAANDAGTPLAPGIAAPLESGLGVDLSPVRVHSDARAAAATAALGVRAFTWGTHVYLGQGERATDLPLIAHEVSHAIQQSAGPAVHLFDGPHGALEHEARSAAATVAGGGRTSVVGRTGGASVQGLFDWARRGLQAVGGAIASVGGAVRDRVLAYIKDRARSIPGYDLLGFILGRDPISQQPVERSVMNLVRGIIGLIPGGHEFLENLERARVIQRAGEWFSAEIDKLNITWPYIRGLFAQAWDALSASDLVHPGAAWDKLKDIFGPPLLRLANFALAAARKVPEFIFEGALALAGGAGQQILAVFRRIGTVFSLIVSHPLDFLSHLLDAVKGGFRKFWANIATHLRTGIFEWLVGALGGIQLPTRWDFAGILSLIMQVLGLTYSALRAVLVRLMGEPAVAFVERAFDFLVTVLTRGLSAAWEKIREFAAGLTDQVIEGIRNWLARSVIGAAVTKLVTMFNPVGAIIQGIITIYNTVMFFIERAQQIARLVNSILDSIERIATGNISAAVDFVERAMANTLPVIIGFLARLIGLGNVTGYIRDIIQRIRTTIANALERIGLWIRERVQGLVARRTAASAPAGSADTPRAAAVKAAALDDVQLSLRQRPATTIEEFHATLVGVLGRRRPEGLKSLAGRGTDTGVTVVAEASAPSPLVLTWRDAFRGEPVTAKDIAALKPFFMKQGYETISAVTVDGRLVGTATSAGEHAEERLISSGIWQQALNLARTTQAGEIALLINRSPCQSCSRVLVDTVRAARAQCPNVRFVLAPTGVYEPSVDIPDEEVRRDAEQLANNVKVSLSEALKLVAKRGVYTVREPDASAGRRGGATTNLDIQRLRSAGWELRLLLARTEATSAGRAWLQGIEPAVRRALAEEVTAKNARL